MLQPLDEVADAPGRFNVTAKRIYEPRSSLPACVRPITGKELDHTVRLLGIEKRHDRVTVVIRIGPRRGVLRLDDSRDLDADDFGPTAQLNATIGALSLLKGYDLLHIDAAFKLRIAWEYLKLAGRPDFEAIWKDGLTHYGSGLWHVASFFVRDFQAGDLGADSAFDILDEETLALKEPMASMETAASFGAFCESLTPEEPRYWERVYERIGLDYTLDSPSGG